MQRVAIVGGGLMGAGIAQVFAAAGHPVRLYEPNESARESLPSTAPPAGRSPP